MFGFVSKKEFKEQVWVLKDKNNRLEQMINVLVEDINQLKCNHKKTEFKHRFDSFDGFVYYEECNDCSKLVKIFDNFKEWQLAKAEKLEKEAQDIKNKLREEENNGSENP